MLKMPVQLISQSAISQSDNTDTQEEPSDVKIGHQPNEFYAPRNVQVSEGGHESNYVLTYLISKELQETMDAWRQRFYPPELNHLPAHVMAFHALPERYLADRVIPDLKEITQQFGRYEIGPGMAKVMGKRGVVIECFHPHQHKDGLKGPRVTPPSVVLYKKLQEKWMDFLSDQDRHPRKLHWTVMNKENEKKKVFLCLTELRRWTSVNEAGAGYNLKDKEIRPYNNTHLKYRQMGWVHGFTLWRYDQGHWKEPQVFRFRGRKVPTETMYTPMGASTGGPNQKGAKDRFSVRGRTQGARPRDQSVKKKMSSPDSRKTPDQAAT